MTDRRRDVGRRTFLKLIGGAVTLTSAGLRLRTRPTAAQVVLTPFVDPLPIPGVIYTERGSPFTITRQAFTQKLHRDLPPTPLWGYNGQYPGPTFENRRGNAVDVLWQNNLPDAQMFPIDDTLHGDEPGQHARPLHDARASGPNSRPAHRPRRLPKSPRRHLNLIATLRHGSSDISLFDLR